MMRKVIYALSVLALMMNLMGIVPAQSASAAQKSDAEIQKCIQESIAKSPSLKEQALTVSVSNGIVTITGKAKNPGSKGAATRIAKKCGAKEVKNDAAVENPARPKPKDPTAPKNNP